MVLVSPRVSWKVAVVLPESPYQSIADVVKTAKAKPNFISDRKSVV